MSKRNPGLESVDHLIPKSMAVLGEKVDRLYRTHYALSHLPELIGSSFADHIHPLGVKNKKLFIYVPEDAWRNEIWMFREEIIARINRCAGEEIVKEIISGRRGYRMPEEGKQNLREDNGTFSAEETKSFHRRELSRVNLTDPEMQELRDSCTKVGNQELQKSMFSLSMKRKKLEKLRLEKKWHSCAGCGALCPPEDDFCVTCASRNRRGVRKQIRDLLWELPWLRYPEIKETVPCTPEMVKSVRDGMVQSLASRVHLEDQDSLDAHVLAMLYLGIPPERLTDELLKRTLYKLRFDLARPREFKPYKRYDVIPWGRKKKKKGMRDDVSSSGK